MSVFSRHQPLFMLALAAVCLVVAATFAVRAGLALSELGALRGVQAEMETKISGLATPAAPKDIQPLTSGTGARLVAKTGERLNVELSRLGLSVVGIDTTSRRPFDHEIEALFLTVRARGDMAAGLKALSWFRANRQAVAVESVQATTAEGEQADWTFKLIVLGARQTGGRGSQ